MKIGPCKDETALYIVFLPIPFVLFGTFYTAFEIGTHSATENAILLAVTIFLCAMLEAVSVSAMVYFGRTITMDPEGCCFSFRGLEKKFRGKSWMCNIMKMSTSTELATKSMVPASSLMSKAENIIRKSPQWRTATISIQ